ncbi:MAG: hypothetical protein AAGE52_00220 [Myxococcota bacterium]
MKRLSCVIFVAVLGCSESASPRSVSAAPSSTGESRVEQPAGFAARLQTRIEANARAGLYPGGATAPVFRLPSASPYAAGWGQTVSLRADGWYVDAEGPFGDGAWQSHVRAEDAWPKVVLVVDGEASAARVLAEVSPHLREWSVRVHVTQMKPEYHQNLEQRFGACPALRTLINAPADVGSGTLAALDECPFDASGDYSRAALEEALLRLHTPHFVAFPATGADGESFHGWLFNYRSAQDLDFERECSAFATHAPTQCTRMAACFREGECAAFQEATRELVATRYDANLERACEPLAGPDAGACEKLERCFEGSLEACPDLQDAFLVLLSP